MKKSFRLTAIGAITALIAVALPSLAFATPNTIHLTVHYQRAGGDYTGWNLWLWKNVSASTGDVDVSATGVQFTSEDAFGKVAKIDITDMANFENVGIIVRLNAWQSKDVSDDRFITNFDADGNAEIWLIQGDKAIYTSQPASTAAIKTATIDGFRQISVALSQKLNLSGAGNEGFTVSDGINVLSVTAINGTAASANELLLNLDSDLTLGKTYFVTLPGYGKIETTPGTIMNSDGFNTRYTYTGDDLGNTYAADHTQFRVWAPTATSVKLVTYPNLIPPLMKVQPHQ
ncbi:MAG: pullulanase-associated domain-containing protein [Actinomycetota bacterium]